MSQQATPTGVVIRLLNLAVWFSYQSERLQTDSPHCETRMFGLRTIPSEASRTSTTQRRQIWVHKHTRSWGLVGWTDLEESDAWTNANSPWFLKEKPRAGNVDDVLSRSFLTSH